MFQGLGSIFDNILKKVTVGADNMLRITNRVTGIQLSDKAMYIKNDGSNNLEITNNELNKNVQIDGKNEIHLKKNGGIKLYIATIVASAVDLALYTGNQIRLYNSSNTYYHPIGDDGSGNLKIEVTESGKDLILNADTKLRLQGTVNVYDSIQGLEFVNPLWTQLTETITFLHVFSIGEGLVPVSVFDLPKGATMTGFACKVKTAPGGGASALSFGMDGESAGSLVDAMGVATGDEGDWGTNGDGTFPGPIINNTGGNWTIYGSLDANVTVSGMEVYYTISYTKIPTWV